MPRRRAVHVCESCHNQKIRCDIDLTGTRCSKCAEIGEECIIRARKPYRGRKRARRSSRTESDNGRVGDHVSVKIVEAAIPEPSSRITTIFAGDGGYGAILDATSETVNRHFHVPTTAEKALAAEDLEYLKLKGCFTLPMQSKELIEAYFKFVHPTFPIIDGTSFLQEYAASGLEGINLLLLWSMFSVSASYVLSLPRKATKADYIQRAKLLFDLSQENNKIVLVQSALLLSFWFADTEDVKQSWYWTSIAFSIAQTLGLHRAVRSNHTPVTAQQRSLWRNIWQCCIIRDSWLAFGMGRPLRIKASECDCPMPENVDCQFTNLVLHGENLYSSKEAAEFVRMWQSLITTSTVLRDIMTNKTLSPSQAKSFKSRIIIHDIETSTFLLKHSSRQLQLHQYALIIALSRASGLMEDSRKAAESTTAVIQAMLHDNTAVYAAPIVVPLVVPAMIIYLTTFRSRIPETKKLAKDKLNIHSQFLTKIEDNYPAASIVERLFAAAQAAIVSTRSNRIAEEETDQGSMDQVPSSWGLDWLEDNSSAWLPEISDPTHIEKPDAQAEPIFT